MWANSFWGLFGFSVTFGLAMLLLTPEQMWLRPYLAGAAIFCGVVSAIILMSPLRHHHNRAKVREVCRHPIKWIPRLLDPSRMIAAGLIIAIIGVALAGIGLWRQPRSPAMEARVAQEPSRPSVVPALPSAVSNTTPPAPALFPADKERINNALVKLHAIVKTKMMGSMDQFHSTLQSIEDGPPSGGYAATLEKLKRLAAEIDAYEMEIGFVLKDNAYYDSDLKEVVMPSGYNAPGSPGLQGEMRNFVHAMEVISKKISNPDGEINSILSNQGLKLQDGMRKYTEWARQTVAKIEAKQKELRLK